MAIETYLNFVISFVAVVRFLKFKLDWQINLFAGYFRTLLSASIATEVNQTDLQFTVLFDFEIIQQAFTVVQRDHLKLYSEFAFHQIALHLKQVGYFERDSLVLLVSKYLFACVL